MSLSFHCLYLIGCSTISDHAAQVQKLVSGSIRRFEFDLQDVDTHTKSLLVKPKIGLEMQTNGSNINERRLRTYCRVSRLSSVSF